MPDAIAGLTLVSACVIPLAHSQVICRLKPREKELESFYRQHWVSKQQHVDNSAFS